MPMLSPEAHQDQMYPNMREAMSTAIGIDHDGTRRNRIDQTWQTASPRPRYFHSRELIKNFPEKLEATLQVLEVKVMFLFSYLTTAIMPVNWDVMATEPQHGYRYQEWDKFSPAYELQAMPSVILLSFRLHKSLEVRCWQTRTSQAKCRKIMPRCSDSL